MKNFTVSCHSWGNRLRLVCVTLCLACFAVLGTGCDNTNNNEAPTVSFDRAAMNRNLAFNIILPNYQEAANQAEALVAAATNAEAEPANSQRFVALQTSLKNAWLAWQGVAAFEVGPAEQVALKNNLNPFPTDTNRIWSNIDAAEYDLNTPINRAAKGFPALDYLLNGTNAASYWASNAAYRAYVRDLAGVIRTQLQNVRQAWQNGYAESYASNTGSDIGSSLGQTVNAMNMDFEVVKNIKIGLPAGIVGRVPVTAPNPNIIECLYGGYSLELIAANLKNIENLYRGRTTSGTDRFGYDDYLDALRAQRNGQLLTAAIDAAWEDIHSTVAATPEPFGDFVVNQNALAIDLYNAMQRMVVLLKTDLPSAFSVQITYNSNDGD